MMDDWGEQEVRCVPLCQPTSTVAPYRPFRHDLQHLRWGTEWLEAWAHTRLRGSEVQRMQVRFVPVCGAGLDVTEIVEVRQMVNGEWQDPRECLAALWRAEGWVKEDGR